MEFDKLLRIRKSIRSYERDRQISEGDLEKILFAGMAAPVSRKDYDSIKFIVVQNKELLKVISSLSHENIELLYGVPTLIIVSSKSSKVKNIGYLNSACIVENMLLAATNIGLGSIYLTSFLKYILDRKDILKELDIPDEYIPISAVGLGYADRNLIEDLAQDIIHRIEVIRK